MTNAITAYAEATTAKEIRAAYDAIVEVIAADDGLDDDADFESYADRLINDLGLPSLSSRLNGLAYAEVCGD